MKITDVGAAYDKQFEKVKGRKMKDKPQGYAHLTAKIDELKREVVRLKGEAESWEKVFDRTCELLADAKSKLAEAVAKERDEPNSTYQTVLAMAAKIRKGE